MVPEKLDAQMSRIWHGHCLNWFVQKAVFFTRSHHLSAPGLIFCVAASLLILAAVTVCAGEPVMTLAMNQPSEKHPAPSFTPSALGTNSLYLILQSDSAAVVTSNATKADLFLPVGQIAVQTNFARGESALLVREDSRSSKPMTVTAGYRQLWDENSTLQSICSGYQEPGFAYLSASFSF